MKHKSSVAVGGDKSGSREYTKIGRKCSWLLSSIAGFSQIYDCGLSVGASIDLDNRSELPAIKITSSNEWQIIAMTTIAFRGTFDTGWKRPCVDTSWESKQPANALQHVLWFVTQCYLSVSIGERLIDLWSNLKCWWRRRKSPFDDFPIRNGNLHKTMNLKTLPERRVRNSLPTSDACLFLHLLLTLLINELVSWKLNICL